VRVCVCVHVCMCYSEQLLKQYYNNNNYLSQQRDAASAVKHQ